MNSIQQNNKCRYCGSGNINFFKKINQGKKQKQFHYGVKCLNCQRKYHVERSKEIFEKVKDLPWEYSKHSSQHYRDRATNVPFAGE